MIIINFTMMAYMLMNLKASVLWSTGHCILACLLLLKNQQLMKIKEWNCRSNAS